MGERRPRATVLYDGQCPLCVSQMRLLRRLDRRGRLELLSLHDEAAARRFATLDRQQLLTGLHVVTRDGAVVRDARALRAVGRLLPALWWTVPLLYLPGSLPLWQRLYRWIAGHRAAISGLPRK